MADDDILHEVGFILDNSLRPHYGLGESGLTAHRHLVPQHGAGQTGFLSDGPAIPYDRVR